MKDVRYIGAGAFLPSRVVKNDRITRAIPGWSAERIESRTGIVERRFLWDFDAERGRAVPPPEDSSYWPRSNTDMAEVAVVATTFASAYLDREVFTSSMPGNSRVSAFLTMYMFGDGAGALILRADGGGKLGVMASTSGTDHPELVIHRGGGAKRQPCRATTSDNAYFVDGPTVARAYPLYMQRAVDELNKARPELAPEVQRYYLHQANKHVLLKFAEQAGIPADRVPINVDRYGNTSAASTLILFAEDLEAGRVKFGSGELVMFAAVGAGVHCGGQLVRV
jgi:3-oxoacyl-[acyl-carrier-protein] synthase III